MYQNYSRIRSLKLMIVSATMLLLFSLLCGNLIVLAQTPSSTDLNTTSDNLALNRQVMASGYQYYLVRPEKAVDGNMDSYWLTRPTGNDWLVVNLESTNQVSRIRLNWSRVNYASEYRIAWYDGADWNAAETVIGDGSWDDITFSQPITTQYIAIRMVSARSYYYALYEFEVYGNMIPQPTSTPMQTPTPTLTPTSTPTSTPTTLPTDFSRQGPFNTTTIRMQEFTIFTPDNLGLGGMKHPIITWGNGTGATPSSYTGLLNHLASHGFVVVASNTTNAGSGREMLQGINLMISENSNPGSRFYDKLDTQAIGASGHSQGGIGTIAAASTDSRIICSVPIQGTVFSSSSFSSPVFAIAGSNDTIVSPSLVRRIYYRADGPAVYGELQGATHFAPVGVRPSSEILHYTTAWFRLYLFGDNYLMSMFYDNNSGINADEDWEVEFKN